MTEVISSTRKNKAGKGAKEWWWWGRGVLFWVGCWKKTSPSGWHLGKGLKDWGPEPCRDLGEEHSRHREQQIQRTSGESKPGDQVGLPFRFLSLLSILLICRTTSLSLFCNEAIRGLSSEGSSPRWFQREDKEVIFVVFTYLHLFVLRMAWKVEVLKL